LHTFVLSSGSDPLEEEAWGLRLGVFLLKPSKARRMQLEDDENNYLR
jgi:hypothetical protein